MLPIFITTAGFVAGFAAYYNPMRQPEAAADAPVAADEARHNEARHNEARQERQSRCCKLITGCFLLSIPCLAEIYGKMTHIGSSRVACLRWNHNTDRLFTKYEQSALALPGVTLERELALKESQDASENARRKLTIAEDDHCFDMIDEDHFFNCLPKLEACRVANSQFGEAGARFDAALDKSRDVHNLVSKARDAYDTEMARRPWSCMWRPGRIKAA